MISQRPTNHLRVEEFTQLLEDFPSDSPPLITSYVLTLVTEMGVTYNDFRYMDELPGTITVVVKGERLSYTRSSWHRRLRIVRNDPDNNLFDLLRDNDRKAGIR